MKFLSVLPLFVVATLAAEDGHAHDNDHPCACEAEELGFSINCSNTEAMNAALAVLATNNCAADCESELCHTNFVIIQSHHDYCLEDEVPEPVETSFHTFEEKCEGCKISRRRDETLVDCPASVCDETTGNEAFARLVTNDCLEDCSSEACAADFRILRAEHDTCEEEVLFQNVETSFHDYEEKCTMNNCNVVSISAAGSPLVCTEKDEDEDKPTSATAGLKTALPFLAMGAMAAL